DVQRVQPAIDIPVNAPQIIARRIGPIVDEIGGMRARAAAIVTSSSAGGWPFRNQAEPLQAPQESVIEDRRDCGRSLAGPGSDGALRPVRFAAKHAARAPQERVGATPAI